MALLFLRSFSCCMHMHVDCMIGMACTCMLPQQLAEVLMSWCSLQHMGALE